VSTAPLRGRLRAIEPAAATRQTRLLAALQNRRAGDLHLTAQLAGERDRLAAAAWIRFDTPDGTVWLAPLLADGNIVRLAGANRVPDAAAAAATLAPIEPLVAALERALGHPLAPVAVASRPEAEHSGAAGSGMLIRIDAGPPAAATLHRVVVALPETATLAPEALPHAATICLPSTRAVVPVRLVGPSVEAARIETISPGDLLLLGTGPLLAQTSMQGASTRRCEIDLKRGSLTVQEVADANNATRDEPTSAARTAAGLRVATVVEIDGGTMSADEATVLAPGSVLSLPTGSGGTLAVRVTAGGQLVGDGELVALGQGFGVLFTSIALSATPLAAPTAEPRVPHVGEQPVGSA